MDTKQIKINLLELQLINKIKNRNKSIEIIQATIRGYWARTSLKLFLICVGEGYFTPFTY